MDFGYLLWKTLAFLSVPSNILTAGAVLALLWALFTRWRGRRGRIIAGAFATALALAAFTPLPRVALAGLEQRFPAFDARALAEPPAAIAVLGGGNLTTVVRGTPHDNLTEAADRMRYAAQLAALYPDVPIYLLGGRAFKISQSSPEADDMARLLVELGVARDRLILERTSRTTAENARNMRAMLGGQISGRVLVVTSAFHMPRAMGVFRALCIDAIAAPADWRAADETPTLAWSVSGSLASADIVVKEYLGMLAYRLTRASRELFPGPKPQPQHCPGR
jgi:uncharacterized SAM-binding protein YcdF (DUF218 family)